MQKVELKELAQPKTCSERFRSRMGYRSGLLIRPDCSKIEMVIEI